MQAELVQLGVRVPKEIKTAINLEAESRFLKEADIVREALREYVQRRRPSIALATVSTEKVEVPA